MLLEFALATLLAAPHPAPRWGATGHRIVARVAAARLSPAARAEVRALLGGSTLAGVSSWADEVRPERPETSPWHYVNIPVTDSVYRPAAHCGASCIVPAAEAQLAILGDRRQPRARRAEALRWVVHLIGDLHQPLHAGDRGDRGGNDVTVWFQNRRTNLHSLWDSRLLESYGRTEEAWVSAVERRAASRGDLDRVAAGKLADWALESHDVARDVVYRRLSPWLIVTPAYAEQAREVIEEQLMRGGVRLAGVLEEALTDRGP